MYWRLNHPFRPMSWEFIAREFVTIQSLNCPLSTVWLYVLCTQIIVTYYEKVADELQMMGKMFCFDDVIRSMKAFKHLNRTTQLVHRRFGLILLVNCTYLVVSMIQTMYYVTRYGNQLGYAIVTFWDSFTMIEVMARLLLISHSTDTIRSSVSQSQVEVFSLD